MRLLRLKLLRDIYQSRWQFIAIVLVVAIGVSFYQAGWMSYQNIGASYEKYYALLHFAHFQIPLSAAPDTLEWRIRQIPGVKRVQARIVSEVELEMPVSDSQQVVGRVISLPDTGRSKVNDVMVIEGSYLGPPHKRDVLVEKSFADYHDLHVGDYVHPVVDGEVNDYRIAGIALGPEYVYAIQSKQYLLPTPSTFGVFWMRRNQAERLLGMSGSVNEVCAVTEPARTHSAMRHAHAMLKQYGAEEPVPREDQPSNYMLQMDLRGYQQMSVIFPFLFLFTAALTIYTLLVRIVNSQRGQIGFLRANGMPVSELTHHYLSYALLCGFAGAVLGVIIGIFESRWITQYYLEFLSIPVIANPINPAVVGIGVFAGVFSCGLAGYYSSRSIAMLTPAEALREEAVPPGHRPILERMIPALARATFYIRIPMRNVFRNPRRTLYTATGIAMGVSLVLVSLGMNDATFDAIDTYISDIQRYDLQATFIPPQVKSLGYDISQWPGVQTVEAALELPVEIHRGENVVNTVLVGMEPGSHLQTLVAPDGRPVQVHGNTLLMSDSNRRKLGVETGDMVRLAFAHNDEDIKIEMPVRIGQIIRQPVGSYVYMPARRVRQIFERDLELVQGSVTVVMLRAQKDHTRMIKERLFRVPNVASVEDARETRGQLLEMMEMGLGFYAMMVLLGAGLALAIIYNTVSITIVERTRELASMRAMGMNRWGIGLLITIENLLIGGLGIAVGVPLGYLMTAGLIASFANDIMELQTVIYPQSYVISIASVTIAILLSQIPGIRQLNCMNLAQATKLRSG